MGLNHVDFRAEALKAPPASIAAAGVPGRFDPAINAAVIESLHDYTLEAVLEKDMIRRVFASPALRAACGDYLTDNEEACIEGRATLYHVLNRGFVVVSKVDKILWVNAAVGVFLYMPRAIDLLLQLARIESCNDIRCLSADPRKRRVLERLGFHWLGGPEGELSLGI